MAVEKALSQPYDPGPDSEGSLAIPAESDRFLSWASKVTELKRGLKNIALPDSGYASAGESDFALGAAMTNSVVSLGDGGSITLQFTRAIRNGDGADFAVFENGFGDEFLELATVEVSSDGQHFVTFPAVSLTPTSQQVWSFGTLNPRNLHNLAGKYRLGFGTPFDLEELKNEAGLDVNHILFLRIRDVVGSIKPEYATLDSQGNPINDPWPTTFPTGGFDLDAVGVIHEETGSLAVYPSMVLQGETFKLHGLEEENEFQIVGMNGQQQGRFVYQPGQSFQAIFPRGWLILQSGSGRNRKTAKLLIQ
jgi:hypothetical protein